MRQILLVLALASVALLAQKPQPDKELYDSAISDIQHKRFDRARMSLQTLVNTYDASEFLIPAKYAIADSWYREGGKHGLEQAEAEFQDFLKLYPNAPQATQARELLSKIQATRRR